MEYINEALSGLQSFGMELESESEVTGFLGVHLEWNSELGTVMLTPKGLTQWIIDISDLGLCDVPAPQDPVGLNKDDDPGCAMYNYASVMVMLQYLEANS